MIVAKLKCMPCSKNQLYMLTSLACQDFALLQNNANELNLLWFILKITNPPLAYFFCYVSTRQRSMGLY